MTTQDTRPSYEPRSDVNKGAGVSGEKPKEKPKGKGAGKKREAAEIRDEMSRKKCRPEIPDDDNDDEDED